MNWRGTRLKLAIRVPMSVLFRKHRTYFEELRRNPSDLEDAIGDGLVELCRLDKETDETVAPPEFLGLAMGRMKVFYRSHYNKAHGVYYDSRTGKTRRKARPRRIDLDLGLIEDRRPHELDVIGQIDEALSVLTEDEKRVVKEVYLGRGMTGWAEMLGISKLEAKRKLSQYIKKVRTYHESV